ncbi:MAG: hypothetical protein ACRD1T_15360, partial [Acidimicrobiia bacterium]
MHKKLFSLLLTVAFVAGTVAVAVPAQADHDFDAVVSYLPDEFFPWEGGFSDSNVLSDRPDGTDSLAHLTAITQGGISNARWYQ